MTAIVKIWYFMQLYFVLHKSIDFLGFIFTEPLLRIRRIT